MPVADPKLDEFKQRNEKTLASRAMPTVFPAAHDEVPVP
jgi:hypothetical protein